uniref:Trihelix transcription factor GT-4 n=1 Tax=Zeugodacus cucurbitae TaxID=28588 RepID=A0A0A1WQ95_ZEUCU
MKSKRNKSEPQLEEIGDAEAAECNETGENCELQSPQTQTRWTPECTRVMLQLRFERQLEFQQRIRQKKELWSEIATEMRRQGLCDFSLTAEVCDLKYRNMLQTYKKNRLKEDSGMQSLIAWEYYDIFKEALTASEDLDAYQEGQERVVPSLFCESVCEVTNEDELWSDTNEIESKLTLEESTLNVKTNLLENGIEDSKNTSNTNSTAVNSRKRSRRSLMKTEAVNPSPTRQLNTVTTNESKSATLRENSKTQTAALTNQNNVMVTVHTQLSNVKPDTSGRPQRKRVCSSIGVATPSTSVETTAVDTDAQSEVPINAIQNDPIISSTSAATMPISNIMHAPPLQPQTPQPPQPPQSAVPPIISQTPITIVHPNNLQAVPIGLAPTEMRECQVFGESVGLQLSNVREPDIRAMLQLKIQELLYLAKTGKLVETVRF